MEFTIHKSVLESINASLMTSGRIYIRELADILKVDSKELIKQILPQSEKIKINTLDKTNTQCQALVVDNNILKRCRLPICINSNEFCRNHVIDRIIPLKSGKTEEIIKLKDSPDRPTLWKKNNDVINSYGSKVGTWNNQYNRLTLFIISKDDCINK